MKYAVIPYRRILGRSTRLMWQVVNHEAGLNERAYPREVIAACMDKLNADRICAMYNGVGVYPDNIDAVRAERDRAQKQRQLAIDERDNLIALLDITKAALSESREIAQRYAAERDALATKHAELQAINSGLLSDLIAARRERDEARKPAEPHSSVAAAVRGLQAAADCVFIHPDARAAFAALAKVYSS
jgi:hypothetical protein